MHAAGWRISACHLLVEIHDVPLDVDSTQVGEGDPALPHLADEAEVGTVPQNFCEEENPPHPREDRGPGTPCHFGADV